MILRRVIQHVKKQEWTAIALDFVIVVFGCLMIITYVPVISIGLRDLVYAK